MSEHGGKESDEDENSEWDEHTKEMMIQKRQLKGNMMYQQMFKEHRPQLN